jgi:TPR repeat protein
MQTVENLSTMKGQGADALFILGLKYCLGREVPKDLITAHKWFNLAAMSGNDAARQYRLEVAREMAPADVAEAQKRARDWLRTSGSFSV